MKTTALKITGLLFLFCMSFFTACISEVGQKNMDEEAKEAITAADRAIEKERKELQEGLQATGDKIDLRIEQLKRDMAEANEDAKEAIKEQIDNLEVKSKDVKERMNLLGERIKDDWQESKKDVRQTINNIEQDLKS